MRFEFDAVKSSANKLKHGIGFLEARAIWQDTDRLETPARGLDEPRWQVVGRHGDKTWSAFVTYRGDSVRIISVRIISAWRARRDEEARYLQA